MEISELSERSEHSLTSLTSLTVLSSELNGQLIIADVSGSVNLADFRKGNFYTVENGIEALRQPGLSMDVIGAVCSLFFMGKRDAFTFGGKREPGMIYTFGLTHGASN
jgi:hypothetical protein